MTYPRAQRQPAVELVSSHAKVPEAVARCFELVSVSAAFTLRFLTAQLPLVACIRKLCFPMLHRAGANPVSDGFAASAAIARGPGSGWASITASPHRDRKED
jgi:hypothetical protein